MSLINGLDEAVAGCQDQVESIKAALKAVALEELPKVLAYVQRQKYLKRKALYKEFLEDIKMARALKSMAIGGDKSGMDELARRFVGSYDSKRAAQLQKVNAAVIDSVHLKGLVVGELKGRVKEAANGFFFAHFSSEKPKAGLGETVGVIFDSIKLLLRVATFPFSELAEGIISRLKLENDRMKKALPQLQFSSDPQYLEKTVGEFEDRLAELLSKNLRLCTQIRSVILSFANKIEMEEEALASEKFSSTPIRNFLQNLAILLNNLLKEVFIHLKEVMDVSQNLLVIPAAFFSFLEVFSTVQTFASEFLARFKPSLFFLHLSSQAEEKFLAFWAQMRTRLNTAPTLALADQLRTRLFQIHAQTLLELIKQRSEFPCVLGFETIEAVENLIFQDKTFSLFFHSSKLIEVQSAGDSFSFFRNSSLNYFLGFSLHVVKLITRAPEQKLQLAELLYALVTNSLEEFQTQGSPQSLIESCLSLGVVQRVFTTLVTKSFLSNFESNLALSHQFEAKFAEVRTTLERLMKELISKPLLTYKAKIEADFIRGESFTAPSPHLTSLFASLSFSCGQLRSIKDANFHSKVRNYLISSCASVAIETLESNNKLFKNSAAIRCEVDLIRSNIQSIFG